MSNHNHLLHSFPGCDGLKTGYFNEAGFNVTATATRNNVRMIAVAMDCRTRKGRDNEVARLLSTGLSQYRPVVVAAKGKPLDQVVAVSGGDKLTVGVSPESDLQAVVRTGDEQKVTKKVEICLGLQAPVQSNTKCGSLVAILGEKEIGRVPLVVNDSVQQVGRIGQIRARLGL